MSEWDYKAVHKRLIHERPGHNIFIDYLEWINEAALCYGLDPALICALCEVESSWIPTAQRHEAGYGCLIGFTRAPLDGNPTNEMRFTDANSYTWRADTKKLAKFGGVVIGDRATILTELLNQQTSVGLMQFMFATARERGLQGRFAELFDPAVNLEWGCRHLRWMIDHNNAYGLPDYRIKPEDLAAAWNGGARIMEFVNAKPTGRYKNQSYVDRVVKAMEHYK